MFSQFFISRPKFAFVISIFITLVGLISVGALPVAQFPQVTPPTVKVTAVYPGASAEVVEETVAVPLEEAINGVEDMIYLSSKAANDGSLVITVTFEVGTDADLASVNVQNRVATAMSKLPEDVVRRAILRAAVDQYDIAVSAMIGSLLGGLRSHRNMSKSAGAQSLVGASSGTCQGGIRCVRSAPS